MTNQELNLKTLTRIWKVSSLDIRNR